MFLHAWRLQFNHPASGERAACRAAAGAGGFCELKPRTTENHSENYSKQRPRRFDLLAFDWDGTVADSTAIISRSIQDAVRDVGGTVPSDEQAAYVGSAWR